MVHFRPAGFSVQQTQCLIMQECSAKIVFTWICWVRGIFNNSLSVLRSPQVCSLSQGKKHTLLHCNGITVLLCGYVKMRKIIVVTFKLLNPVLWHYKVLCVTWVSDKPSNSWFYHSNRIYWRIFHRLTGTENNNYQHRYWMNYLPMFKQQVAKEADTTHRKW